eukprot:CAMPEP_0185593722 /NCGR_PEP_ID=MMETSP0434-20130131/72396_1 /TAXON_ID=626734 ORGANISM="Favella taraikaensis, Strain Fe Narragansett Bay" /NCGR_SAMPLE_ID=MMETSP0434 /ASSEMBLY_ACC=CAM_ASM_000379 /LENGTH=36 /DNA_ID= /DNA_START= /DNA_END= /DNA_ORIENTATION=
MSPIPYPMPMPVTPMPMRGFGASPLGIMGHSMMSML